MDNALYVCPYWRRDIKSNLYCEAARLDLKSPAAMAAYRARYCACMEGWRRCTLAGILGEQYEKEC